MVVTHTHNQTLALAAIFLFLGAFIHTTVGSPTGHQVADVPSPPTAPGLDYGTTSTPLGNAVQFLKDFGFFSVILPFLLIFAIVFGILEKTRIFGTEKVGDKDLPRRNLNSVVAFCIAFFVVAASNVVGIIQASIPAIALVLVIIIVFLILFGSLMTQDKLQHGVNLWDGPWGKTFSIAILIAVIAIFLAVFGVLDDVFGYVGVNMGGTFMTSLILLVIVVGALYFMMRSPKGSSP